MIDRRQRSADHPAGGGAVVLSISRSNVYYLLRPVSDTNLAIMLRLD